MYAETGHLCVSTLHANSADQTMDRILNFFPLDARNQILQDLSLYLKAIVAQRLCDGVDGKRVATTEIMINTPHISDLFHKGKLHEIKAAMNKARHPNRTTASHVGVQRLVTWRLFIASWNSICRLKVLVEDALGCPAAFGDVSA